MKLLITLALVGLATAASVRDDKPIFVDTPEIVDEKSVVEDESPVILDETPILGDEMPVVLPEAPEPMYEHVDIGMLIVPESVMEALKLSDVIDSIQFVGNSDADEVPVDMVQFVDFAENTDFEPIAAEELEPVRVSQDEFPTVVDTVQFVDNSDADEVPVDTVHFVDFAENTDFEPIAAGELESVRVSQDEFPTEELSPDTVHVVDLPVFENLPPRYPDPTWR